jgi:hypothetical protein
VLDSEAFLCGVNPGASGNTVLVGRITDRRGKIIACMVNWPFHCVSLGGATS